MAAPKNRLALPGGERANAGSPKRRKSEAENRLPKTDPVARLNARRGEIASPPL